MIMHYITNIYDYIISIIFSYSCRPAIKHKISEDISDDDIEETRLLEARSKIPIPLSRAKTHIPFEKYPTYQCGHCGNLIQMPQYLFQDMVFCSIMCRTHYISVIQNRKRNASV